MGRPIEPVDPGQRVTTPGWMLDRPGAADYYVLRVVGDLNAEDAICDGDYVICERREVPRPGELAVVLIGDEATIKRWYPEGDVIRLQPANRTLKPIRVKAAEVRVQGVVVGLMRKF
jgi:repressor LexA